MMSYKEEGEDKRGQLSTQQPGERSHDVTDKELKGQTWMTYSFSNPS